MINKPNKYADWCIKNNKNGLNNTPTKVEYPQSKIDDGWDVDEIPPREWENYKNNLVGQWLRYLDEQLQKVSTVGVPVGVALPTFPSLGGYKCVALEKADEFGFVLCNGQIINDQESPFNGKTIPNLNNNNFLKGSNKDNVLGGNKNNNVNFNHTHNYAHTHEVTRLKIDNAYTGRLIQLFYENARKGENEPDYVLSFNPAANTSAKGSGLQLVNSSHDYRNFYTSGVLGDAINGVLDKAETSNISGKSDLNIEPQNVTTVYIIRIK
jgi:hypothetical protein